MSAGAVLHSSAVLFWLIVVLITAFVVLFVVLFVVGFLPLLLAPKGHLVWPIASA